MYSTEIKIKDKLHKVVFSFETVTRMNEDGISTIDIGQGVAKLSVKILAKAIQHGIDVGAGIEIFNTVSESDVQGWIMDKGILSQEVMGVFTLFAKSISGRVAADSFDSVKEVEEVEEVESKNEKAVKATGKPTPQKVKRIGDKE